MRKFSGFKFHVMILDKTRKCAEIPGKGGWGKLRLRFVRGGRAGELRVEPEWNISFHETVRASSLSLPWLAIAGPFILNPTSSKGLRVELITHSLTHFLHMDADGHSMADPTLPLHGYGFPPQNFATPAIVTRPATTSSVWLLQ